MDLKIVFTDYDDNLDTFSSIREGTEGYHVWGNMDILINGVSFFYKYKNHNHDGPMGSSSMSIEGLTVPVFGFIWSFLYYYNKIGVQKVEIEDDQINKELVIIPLGDKIKFSIKHDTFGEGNNWYDGKKILLSSNDFQVNTLNCVPTKDFKLAVKKGILEFISSLLSRFPELIKVKHFESLYKKVEILSE
jgi:hypothetical protein